eukprot:8359983-Lingulodinium_polyedra.AAC.1
MDRKLYTSLGRHLSARHKWLVKELETSQGLSKKEAELASLTNWQVQVPCCIHDAMNAIDWSLTPHLRDGFLKDIWHICQSVRESMVFVLKELPRWLKDVVRFREAGQGQSDKALNSFWAMAGVQAD